MLDFNKAFDTVAHNHLLHKLHFYGIRDKAHNWLTTWLTQRTRVVLDGSSVNVQLGYCPGACDVFTVY